MMNLLWMLDSTNSDSGTPPATPTGPSFGTGDLTGFWTTISPIISTVLYVLAGVLLVVLLIKGITTALAVVKAADEPQVRQEKLNAFKYMAIGLGIAVVVLAISGVALQLAGRNITGEEPAAFLF